MLKGVKIRELIKVKIKKIEEINIKNRFIFSELRRGHKPIIRNIKKNKYPNCLFFLFLNLIFALYIDLKNNVMKKFIFYLITIIILIIPIYFIVGIWGIFEINKNSKNLFKSKENLYFHKKYSEKLHHLRDSGNLRKTQDYLFSEVYTDNNFKKTLLVQGDSWAEQISQVEVSKNLLKDFSKRNKINSFNAGTTSFAPSVMHIQYKILKNDFKIFPDTLIILIDQTDLGDEVCRYEKNKVYSSSKVLLFIKREKFTRATYDYSKLYDYSELYLQNSTLKTIINFPYVKLRYFLKRNYHLIKNIVDNGFKNRNNSKCNFGQIQKELLEFDLNSKIIFQRSLREYLNYLSSEKKLSKILIVSFPHKNHLTNLYKVNVSNYIDEVVKEVSDKRLYHLNFSNFNFSKTEISDIFIEGDVASHLKDQYHAEMYLKKILNNLNY